MIGVLTASTASGNVLGYDLGDKREKDQRIQILDFEGVFIDPELIDRLNQNWTDSASKKEFKKISRKVANDLSKQFDAQAAMSERIVKTTGHIALSFSPADAKLLAEKDEDFKIQIAKEYMEQMGITDTQWVFTWHLDTRCPHGHIAYNRVRSDGTVIDGKNERYRSQKVSEKISRKYGFALGGEVERNLDALCDKRKAYAQMRLLALEALSESCSIDEYEANLRRRGVELRASGGGYCYSTKSGKYPAKGSKLDRKALSYDAVTTTIKQNLAARQAQKEADRQKAEAEAKAAEKAAQESARQEQNDLVEGYRSAVLPVGNQLNALKKSAYELYKEAKDSGISLSVTSMEVRKQLFDTWKKNDEYIRQIREANNRTDTVTAICGILICLNPLVGLTAMLLASLASDIHMAFIVEQKSKLLNQVESLRDELAVLESDKAALNIQKQERLQQYLDAKRMYKEYRESLQTVDREVKAIKNDLPATKLNRNRGPHL